MTTKQTESRPQGQLVFDPTAVGLFHMIAVLFKPFRILAWLGIGFMAFLATNVAGVGFFIFFQGVGQIVPQFFVRVDEGMTNDALDWYANNMGLFWGVTLLALLIITVLVLLGSWIRSRGMMMFLHGTATGEGSIPDAWRESRVPGNSLFRWQVLLMGVCVAGFLLGVLIFWISVATAPPADRPPLNPVLRALPPMPLWGILVMIAVWVITLFAVMIVESVLLLVLVPAMYIRRCSLLRVYREIRSELLPGHFWTFVGFFFFQIALSLLVQMAIQIIVMVTCFFGMMPYIGSVLHLPATIAFAGYQLAFYQQFGERWQSLSVVEAPMPTPPPPGTLPPTSPQEFHQ